MTRREIEKSQEQLQKKHQTLQQKYETQINKVYLEMKPSSFNTVLKPDRQVDGFREKSRLETALQ